MTNYFIAECNGCQKVQSGYTKLSKESARLKCKSCGRSNVLKCNQHPEGSYVWYFGTSLHAASAIIKKIKSLRYKLVVPKAF